MNFGTPRISYGGYQIGLAFYKAVLQGFGPALSATVVRDRLIGVFFGLLVFGAVEHLLWPTRAQDTLRARLAEVLRLLANLARSGTSDKPPAVIADEVDSWRRRISQKVEDIQRLIESSKFEFGNLQVDEIQKCTADGQLIFVLLLSLARQSRDIAESHFVRAAQFELDRQIATSLEALAIRATGGSERTVPHLDDPLNAFERSISDMATVDQTSFNHFVGRLTLYRTLVGAIKQLSLESLNIRQGKYWSLSSGRERFFERRETQVN